jgi:3-oxoacyl-(acyl-carrier-protein) synthase
VQYTCRFYDETIKNPATASPLVFPETVYAAPTSHVAALLENVVLAYSLVGDPSSFLQGVALGAQWLEENRVDACIVFGAEETNWIIADAALHLDRSIEIAAGAGALCLCRDEAFPVPLELKARVELKFITDAHTFTAQTGRPAAARAMRMQLETQAPAELLVDSTGYTPRTDAAELAAWSDWTGARVSPRCIFGDGMMAAAAWQCVAACDAVAAARPAANVSIVGFNQQAIGARFIRAGHTPMFSRTSDLSAADSTGNIRP